MANSVKWDVRLKKFAFYPVFILQSPSSLFVFRASFPNRNSLDEFAIVKRYRKINYGNFKGVRLFALLNAEWRHFCDVTKDRCFALSFFFRNSLVVARRKRKTQPRREKTFSFGVSYFPLRFFLAVARSVFHFLCLTLRFKKNAAETRPRKKPKFSSDHVFFLIFSTAVIPLSC